MKLAHLILVIILLLFPLNFTRAVNISLNSDKSVITSSDEEFPVNVTLSINAADSTIYSLRGVFYKPGTTNYCGYTWNGNAWFKGPYTSGEGWKNFLTVSTFSNSWVGELKAKIDTSVTACQDYGEYNFKVQRFTQSGSGTFDPQTPLTIIFTTPSLTPSPTTTFTPTTTPSPTLTSTPTPTITPTITITPSITPTPSPSLTITPTMTPTNTLTPTPTQSPTPTASITPTPKPEILPSITPTPTLNPTLTPTPTSKELFRMIFPQKVFTCTLTHQSINWFFGIFMLPRIVCGYD